MTGATFGRDERAKDGKKEKEDEEEEEGSEDGKVGGGGDEGGGENKVGGGSGSSSVPVLLPEVQRVTGEEGENKIVQVSYSVVYIQYIFTTEQVLLEWCI